MLVSARQGFHIPTSADLYVRDGRIGRRQAYEEVLQADPRPADARESDLRKTPGRHQAERTLMTRFHLRGARPGQVDRRCGSPDRS